MPEAVVIGLLIAFPLLGVLARRWAALLLPLVGWPLFYLGLDEGWWLFGTGDGWQAIAVFLTVVGVATTALAIAVARGLGQRSCGAKAAARSTREPRRSTG